MIRNAARTERALWADRENWSTSGNSGSRPGDTMVDRALLIATALRDDGSANLLHAVSACGATIVANLIANWQVRSGHISCVDVIVNELVPIDYLAFINNTNTNTPD